MTARTVLVVTTIGYAATLVVAAVLLPARVPIHFGAGGRVDRWAGHTEAVVTMGLIGASTALVLGGTAAAAHRLPVSLVNTPHRDWWTATPERERRMRDLLATDLYLIAAWTMLLLTGLLLLTLRASVAEPPSLGAAVWVLLGVYLAGVLGWTVHMMTTRYRPED